MRILQIHNAYRQRGGEDAVADAEAALLEAAGHDVRRLIVTNPAGMAAAAKLAVVAWNPRSARLVKEAVAAFEPDVAHVHNTWFSLSSSAVAALHDAGVPTVMTLHNYRYTCLNGQLLRDGEVCRLCVGRLPTPGITYRCYRDSYPSSVLATVGVAAARRSWPRHVDRFIVMSEFARNVFGAAGLPEERLIVKPHHVADPGPRAAPPSASRSIVFVGRLAMEKGIEVLLDAWRQAAPDGYELVVVGEGPLGDRLRATAPPSVRFTGWLPAAEVQATLRTARLLAFPSIWFETFGLAMVEAMAAATPVIASDLGGTPELVGGTGTGSLVPAGDVAAWAQRLRTVVADDHWIDDNGRIARKSYEARFTPTQALAALESVYAACIPRSRTENDT